MVGFGPAALWARWGSNPGVLALRPNPYAYASAVALDVAESGSCLAMSNPLQVLLYEGNCPQSACGIVRSSSENVW